MKDVSKNVDIGCSWLRLKKVMNLKFKPVFELRVSRNDLPALVQRNRIDILDYEFGVRTCSGKCKACMARRSTNLDS